VKRINVIWSNEALTDMEIIYDFLAEKSQLAAQRIIENLLARTIQLEAFPESGAIDERLSRKGKSYRYLVEGNYKIIYRYQEGQAVFVEIVYDTRYDPDKI
jgi:plasmid stabilization system protein ParE